MRVHFVVHERFEAPGVFETWAMIRGHEVTFSRVYRGQELPDRGLLRTGLRVSMSQGTDASSRRIIDFAFRPGPESGCGINSDDSQNTGGRPVKPASHQAVTSGVLSIHKRPDQAQLARQGRRSVRSASHNHGSGRCSG